MISRLERILKEKVFVKGGQLLGTWRAWLEWWRDVMMNSLGLNLKRQKVVPLSFALLEIHTQSNIRNQINHLTDSSNSPNSVYSFVPSAM